MSRYVKSTQSLKSIRVANYSSHASSGVKITNVDGGIKVATEASESPLATLSLVAKAGSRYETKLGSSHFLKNFAFKNTAKRTGFRVTREAELQGASLYAQSTRENVIYTAQFFKSDAPYFIEALSDIAQHTKFNDYEVSDIAPTVAFESVSASSQIKVIDSLHRVAFREGLANSTLATPHSRITGEDLRAFAKQALAPARLTFIGTNVDHELLSKSIGEYFEDNSSTSTLSSPSSKYYGGESRVESSDAFGHLALGFEGASLGSNKEAAFTVLRHILGGETHVKWGSGASPLAKAASSLSFPTSISSFNFSYSDAGLFGVYVTSPADKIKEAAEAALSKLRELSSKVSAEDVKRGISQARLEAYTNSETQLNNNLVLSSHVSTTGKSLSSKDLVSQFEKVTEKDIAEILKGFQNGKASIALQGQLATMPYGDQLKL